MNNQVPSNQELRANAESAAEQAQAFMNVANNRANTAEAEQTRATKAANIAENSRVAADEAKNSAESSAVAARQFQIEAKASADAAATEKQNAGEAANSVEQAKANSQAHAQAVEEVKNNAEAAAMAAEQFKSAANDHLVAAGAALERLQNAEISAVSAAGKAVHHAIVARDKVEQLNKTLEHAITATLGGAFQDKSERSRRLDFLWLTVLLCGIFGILGIGYLRFDAIAGLIRDRAEISYITLQLLINLASMSGPIWLSWVATLRLAKTHAITEDYSYKAALAQAYQGYSTSVAEKDEFLKYRLFSTVITQLDATPVRFLSEKHPATPFQDLLQQPWMEEVLKEERFRGQFVEWLKAKFKTPFISTTQNEASK